MASNELTVIFKQVGLEEVNAKMDQYNAKLTSLTHNTNGTVNATGKVAGAMDGQAGAMDRVSKATDRASRSQEGYFVHIAKTTIQSALVNKAFLGLTSAAGEAVKQVDLFTNFPAAMGALGLSTTDASASLLKLRGYAAQTGISLTEATQSVTRFAEVTKDVKAATVEFEGVKNALIAGGAGTEVQKNALEQLTQAYSRGKPQLIEWRSLMVAMPAQLTAVAKAMKLPNAQALGESLTSGKTTMQEFMTQLTTMSLGTGEIAKQMRARMSGIEYSSNVMKQTLTNGLAAIIQAIGRENIVSFFSFLTQVISVLASWTVILINDLIKLFNLISGVFGGPQISGFAGDAKKSADALGTGAGNANDMADGLGNAADNAQKINKSLASFDKMNVLPDKTSGKDKNNAPGQNGLDPATAAKLDALFNGLPEGLKEASKWAKIFAGILAGILGTMTLLRGIRWFNDTVNDIKTLGKNLDTMASNAKKLGDNLKTAFSQGFDKGTETGTKAKDKGFQIGQSIISGISGALAGAAGVLVPAVIGFLAPIGVAIAAVFGVEIAAGIGAALLAFGVIIAVIAVIVAAIWLIWTNWDTIWGFIKAVFESVWNFIVGLWNTLFAIFEAPVRFIWQFITAIFILIVAIIATALELIFKLVVGTIYLIYVVLAAIAGWINDNVIQPVWQFFQWLWDTITGAVVAAWQFIFNNVLKPIAQWIYNNVITPVVNFFKSMWDKVAGFFTGIFNSFVNIFSPIGNWLWNNVIQPVFGFFQGLWDRILQGLKNMWEGLKNVFGSLGGIIKAPINGVIDLINIVLRSMNKIKVPDWVPGLGGKGVNFPMIPTLAKGGIVQQATMAVIGENGAEAVMPLENNTGWIDTLASKLNEKAGNQPVQLVVQIGEDKVASKMIDLINEKTNMSGRNVIYV